ncbi:uncharacterized protein [Musca autumnalis]|uniref:uncharacterized protein n=1 Tax=Musca autumnalis TaxID=221902 RepID=UPI003CF2A2C1
MACPYEICNIKDDNELCVSCWFCLDQWHVKCARISANVVDTINQNVGVRWCCVNCRKLSADFYNFVKDLQNELKSIKDEFISVSSRFESFSNLFDKYRDLDDFVSSPFGSGQKRKRAAKKAPNKSVPIRKALLPAGNTRSQSVSTPDKIEAVCDQSYAGIAAQPALEVGKGSVVGVVPLESMSNGSVALKNASQPSPSIQEPQVPTTVAASGAGSATNGKPLQSDQRPLSMTPVMKAVFLSRFPSETTADDINYYIKSKIEGDYFLRGFKLRSSFSINRSSFKIVVNENIFNQLMLKEFWPAKAFIKEFVERSDNLAHLPQRPVSVSKN